MFNQNTLLAAIPAGLRNPLIATYVEIARNYAEHRWEPSELNGGKFCEVVYTILDGATSGTFASVPSKPAELVEACRAIEQRPGNANRVGDRSLRILLPRLLPFLYEIRNNRGVGHVGGDVDPNHSDATAVFSCANWALAELIRIFHGVTLIEAQSVAEALVERKHPLVWETDGIKRVLNPSFSTADEVVILLYSTTGWITDEILKKWTDYKNGTHFKSKILGPLHKDRMLEYDAKEGKVKLTPRGAKYVEDNLLGEKKP
jgi:hypothetical protein